MRRLLLLLAVVVLVQSGALSDEMKVYLPGDVVHVVVGAPADNGKTVGGSAPNFLATHGEVLFVSNGNNDMIERVDLAKNQIVAKEADRVIFMVAGIPMQVK